MNAPPAPNVSSAPATPILSARRPGMPAAPGKDATVAEEHNTRLPLPPGSVIGEYTIISKLGKGGFGITYRAKHNDTGSIVVIKEHIPEGMAMRMPDGYSVISSSPDKEEEFRITMAEFMEEVSILMGLEHPGIVPILSAFEANGTAYYAMPFVEGEQLRIPEKPSFERNYKANEARKIKQQLRSLLLTLEYLEQHNIVHRDIKPENIIVNEEGRPILLDFGSARQLQSGKIFTNIYTPDFCAPEQSTAKSDAEMSSKLSVRTDIYSLAACFYYLITRLMPPRADMRVHASPDPYKPLSGRKDLLLHYDSYFLQAIDRALSIDARERWQDAATWRLCTETGIVPPPRSVLLRMRIYMAIALIIIVALGSLSIIAWREKSQTHQMYLNGLKFTESLLHDFNTELADLPGSTRLQRKLGTSLKTYLDSMEGLPGADDERLQLSMATAWQNMGAVFVQQGKLQDASLAYQKAAELLSAIYDANPENIRTQYELSKTLRNCAEISRRRNQLEQGKQHIKYSMDLIRSVCEQSPRNPDYRCSLGETLSVAAQLADNCGDMDLRLKLTEDMLSLYRELVSEYPRHEASLKGLARAQISMAKIYLDSNNFSAAEALLRESKDILYALADEAPHRLSIQQWLSTVYYNGGMLHYRQAQTKTTPEERSKYLKQAQAAFEKCASIAKELETMDRDNAEYSFQQCRAMAHLADIAMKNNDLHTAEHISQDALERIELLLETAPNNVEYAQIRAGLVRNLAMVHSKQETEKAKATAEFTEYREIIRNLLKQSPNNPILKYMYADALAESAAHASDMGDVDQAMEWLQEASEFLDRLTPNAKKNRIWATRLQSVQGLMKDVTKDIPTH